MLFYVRAIERGRLFAALALARLRSPAVACGRLRSPAVACGRLPAHAVAAESGHLAAVRLDGRLLWAKVCVCWVFGVFGGLRETTRGAFRFTRRFRAATWDFQIFTHPPAVLCIVAEVLYSRKTGKVAT